MYSYLKSFQKAGIPIGLSLIVRIALIVAKNNGIDVDENTIWTIAGAGYGAFIGFINWLKNHKK